LTLVSRRRIENCMPPFKFRCPRQWEELSRTRHGDAVRFCSECGKHVYYCHTLEDAWGHASVGRCVAISAQVPRTEGDLATDAVPHLLGLMNFPEEPSTDPGPPTSVYDPGAPSPAPQPQRWWWRRLFRRS